MCPLFQTYCHQTPRQAPTVHPCSHTVVAVIVHGRLRQFPAGSSRLSKPNRVHLSLRSIWFFRLLPTPPHGDAVTSSSRQHIGCQRPRSLTLKEDTALQRTGTPITRCPPRRSRRAELPHRAPRRTRIQSNVDIQCFQIHHAGCFTIGKDVHSGFSTTCGKGRSQSFKRLVNWVHVIERR